MTKKHPEEWSWSEILERAQQSLENWEKHKDDPGLKEWIDTRPPPIREMVLSHPDYQVYRVKEGAPYSGTHPGCIGVVMAYTERTEGRPGWCAIKFGMIRAAENRPYMPIFAHVDPEWLEPVPIEELEEQARLEVN